MNIQLKEELVSRGAASSILVSCIVNSRLLSLAYSVISPFFLQKHLRFPQQFIE